MKDKARDFGSDLAIDFPTGAFNRSQTRQGSYDLGKIYPVYVTECLPGEHIEISNAMNLAFTETLSAIRHEVNAVVDWHWIPYGCMPNLTEAEKAYLDTCNDAQKLGDYDPRYGWRNPFWQKLITGGFNGKNVDVIQGHTPDANDLTPGSLWDHFGLPMTIDAADYTYNKINIGLWRAYTLVYNFNYRDENWQSAYNPTGATLTVAGDPSESILGDLTTIAYADWEKDYFTTVLKDQQRGDAQAVDVEGIANAMWPDADFSTAALANPTTVQFETSSATKVLRTATGGNPAQGMANAKAFFADNSVAVTGLGIDIAKLRLSVATQRVLERNARAGARESEFYRAHFKKGPRDNRGDQPHFIGRFKQPITFSDVTNVSVAGTPAPGTAPTIATQTMGHRQSRGDATGAGYVGSLDVTEYGILMAVLIIRPRPMYYQKTEKQWFAGRGRWDFPLPELANLSEQAVLCRELAPATAASVSNVFGYQGRWDEYRQKVNDAVGLLRPTGATGGTANLRSWNMGRNFTGVPVMGDTFLKVDPALIKTANFVYTTADVPMIIGTIGNLVHVTHSPLPQIAQPGLMDHI